MYSSPSNVQNQDDECHLRGNFPNKSLLAACSASRLINWQRRAFYLSLAILSNQHKIQLTKISLKRGRILPSSHDPIPYSWLVCAGTVLEREDVRNEMSKHEQCMQVILRGRMYVCTFQASILPKSYSGPFFQFQLWVENQMSTFSTSSVSLLLPRLLPASPHFVHSHTSLAKKAFAVQKSKHSWTYTCCLKTYGWDLLKFYRFNAIPAIWNICNIKLDCGAVQQWQNRFFLWPFNYCRKLVEAKSWSKIFHWQAVHVFWCPPYMDHLSGDLKKWGKLMVVIFPVFSTDFPPN